MVKKIRDITPSDYETICNEYESCDKCPVCINSERGTYICIASLISYLAKPDLAQVIARLDDEIEF